MKRRHERSLSRRRAGESCGSGPKRHWQGLGAPVHLCCCQLCVQASSQGHWETPRPHPFKEDSSQDKACKERDTSCAGTHNTRNHLGFKIKGGSTSASEPQFPHLKGEFSPHLLLSPPRTPLPTDSICLGMSSPRASSRIPPPYVQTLRASSWPSHSPHASFRARVCS